MPYVNAVLFCAKLFQKGKTLNFAPFNVDLHWAPLTTEPNFLTCYKRDMRVIIS